MASQHLLSDLITEVAGFCRARRGRVTQLAADLGVSQPHVSLWLSRRQEPSGENALRLQRWLTEQREAESKASQATIGSEAIVQVVGAGESD
jgi:transcriptional regulator with XRE-family HTH domain